MHTAKVVFSAEGVPSLAEVKEVSMIAGAIAGVTGIISHTEVVLPGTMFEKLAVEGTKAALAATGQKYISTGQLSIPFTA